MQAKQLDYNLAGLLAKEKRFSTITTATKIIPFSKTMVRGETHQRLIACMAPTNKPRSYHQNRA